MLEFWRLNFQLQKHARITMTMKSTLTSVLIHGLVEYPSNVHARTRSMLGPFLIEPTLTKCGSHIAHPTITLIHLHVPALTQSGRRHTIQHAVNNASCQPLAIAAQIRIASVQATRLQTHKHSRETVGRRRIQRYQLTRRQRTAQRKTP